LPIPKSKTALIDLVAQLGAPNPTQWATSELSEGIPQLLRFLFLREAWRNVQDEDDHSWIEREISSAAAGPENPYAQLGSALSRCREKGVSDQDLTDICRCLQVKMMFNICYLLSDGPQDVPEQLEDVAWSLFRVNENERPVGPPVDALHESVLETDPTGREMRPREAFQETRAK
jgi:hypothetical protein